MKKNAMTFQMTVRSIHDYIGSYENAIMQLQASPDDRAMQHQAVLALARMGALDLALAEYDRYGLPSVRHHEDIMALGARLSKDLYLSSKGAAAKQHSLNSAQKYEAAYKDTQGYYSGINSATMALLADMPEDIVKTRAQHIEKALPPTKNLTPTDYYFIEATRAECALLLNNIDSAIKSLRSAIEFDPLNYTAHTTTLKQFRLIQNKKAAPTAWLKEFSPPRPAHFAGHIWNDDKPPKAPAGDDLLIEISDAIQKNDIGYGFGALAAGADIVIAERLIQEGAELHVILPSDTHSFVNNSVRPFGEDWVARFTACMTAAKSVKTMSACSKASELDSYLIAGNVAMGQAIIKGQQFDVQPAQVLLHDNRLEGAMTSLHAAQWLNAGLTQFVLPISTAPSKTNTVARKAPKALDIVMSITGGKTGGSKTETFTSLHEALLAGRSQLKRDDHASVALAYDCDDVQAQLSVLTAKGFPNSILLSDDIASSVALSERDENVTYAGIVKGVNDRPEHIYTLRG